MERFSSRPPRQQSGKASAGKSQEDFAEMVDATANRPGFFGKLLVLSLIIVSIAVTAFVGYAIVNGVGSSNYIEEDKYQAVFLSDGQIYFGKLDNVDMSYATLEDIYYLQVQNDDGAGDPPLQEGGAAAASITLRKLGNEIHGPVDQMIINGDQILFWENLKDDGQVAQAIERYKEEQKSTADTTTDVTTDETADETP